MDEIIQSNLINNQPVERFEIKEKDFDNDK